jgi:uncharacterized membrane protein
MAASRSRRTVVYGIFKEPAAGWGPVLVCMVFGEIPQDQVPGSAALKGHFEFKVRTFLDSATEISGGGAVWP